MVFVIHWHESAVDGIHAYPRLWHFNKAEVNVFLEVFLSCFFNDPTDVGSLISGSSAFSKSSLNIWKFIVHILLKPGLENVEHYFANMWDECNCAVVRTFFGIAFLWYWNENWPFQVLWLLLSDMIITFSCFWENAGFAHIDHTILHLHKWNLSSNFCTFSPTFVICLYSWFPHLHLEYLIKEEIIMQDPHLRRGELDSYTWWTAECPYQLFRIFLCRDFYSILFIKPMFFFNLFELLNIILNLWELPWWLRL